MENRENVFIPNCVLVDLSFPKTTAKELHLQVSCNYSCDTPVNKCEMPDYNRMRQLR